MNMKPLVTGALLMAVSAVSVADSIYINQAIDYANKDTVANNIVEECTQLGTKLASSVETYGKKQGLDIVRTNDKLEGKGSYLDIKIASAHSAGNAFIGHRKSASASVSYYVAGKKVGSKTLTRNSSGGFFGGFKGSCAVLGRTVNTIGNDIAKWVKAERS